MIKMIALVQAAVCGNSMSAATGTAKAGILSGKPRFAVIDAFVRSGREKKGVS
jgi:hypothetical protein